MSTIFVPIDGFHLVKTSEDPDLNLADIGIVELNHAKLISRSAFEFPVFNGGARACLGKKMAEVLAVGVITNLISKYEFREIMDIKLGGCGLENDRYSKTSLTLPMEKGLPCYVSPRANPYDRAPGSLNSTRISLETRKQ